MLLLLALAWGASFFFMRVAVQELPSVTVAAARLAVAAVALLALLRLRGIPLPRGRAEWIASAKMGFTNNAIPYMLITFAMTRISSSLGAMINATIPLFTAVLAHFFTTDERLTARRTIGVLIGFSGIVVMLGLQAFASLGGQSAAQLASLSASVVCAFGAIVSRRQQRLGLPPLVMATGQLTTAAAMVTAVALVVDHPWALPHPSFAALGAIAMVGLFSTAFAFALFFKLLATAGATNVSLVMFVVPVVSALLGTLLLGEVLAARQVLGMTIITLGFVIIDGRAFGALRRLVG